MSSEGLLEHCLELLAPLGQPRSRRMFGGHGLYVDDLFIALIAFERLYLKVDDASRAEFEAAGCEPFVYEAKGKRVSLGYWSAPEDAMDSAPAMTPWARLAMHAALRARQAKPAARSKKTDLSTGRKAREPAPASTKDAASAASAPAKTRRAAKR